MNRTEIGITKQTAARYLLMKQGLFGDYTFEGKSGAYAYVRQAGCIQFDPVDSVGRNAELTLQSRVKGFRKKDLYSLLYRDRLLVDYFDKELAIIPTEDWPYFRKYRDLCRRNGQRFEGLAELEEQAVAYIRKHGYVSSATLPLSGNISWHSSIHWSGDWDGGPTKASRSVLEQLYTAGELIIHHKDGARTYYDLAEKHIARELLEAEDPLPDVYDYSKWRVKRRIGAVGMLWNRGSTAFLGIREMSPADRNRIFEELYADGETVQVHVEGIRTVFYVLREDVPLLEKAMNSTDTSHRCEFLAPLDPLLWDRALIEKIFDYQYTWEIYTPREKRKYGYYVLPVLYGERLVGRIEPVIVNGELVVKGIWLEPGVRKTRKLNQAINVRLKRFARFNDCTYTEQDLWDAPVQEPTHP